MVNKALQEMIQGRFGDETWYAIRDRSGVSVEVFVSNNGYPDEVTYSLLGAASQVLDLPAESLLHDFGKHWVMKTARDGYGDLMDAGGRSLPEFLQNLPSFHARIALIFPHLRPPRFTCSEMTGNSLQLHYFSDRPALDPFVEGLLKGLGEMFGTPVSVRQITARGPNSDHAVFDLHWEDPQP